MELQCNMTRITNRRSALVIEWVKHKQKKILADLGEINKKNCKWKRHERFVRKEIKIHSSLQHHNIVKLLGVIEDSNCIWLVLELCSNGSVDDYMEALGRPFSEAVAHNILRQVIDGVMYLQDKLIIHRDLSLKNILLTEDMQAKIADFGLSTDLEQPDETKQTMVGTANYMPPEMALRTRHGLKVDCWSLGCMLYTMLDGSRPSITRHAWPCSTMCW
ncbi:hypothetical protein CEXT_613041 [Caerostris extrusa]|uniref:Protein kinase domain-containing protein n=1 Tax=Caerostris extrusa TaxID=172846 RepID=A0AAV4V2D1_CAEEX|nr:hypothetical protein CEXT_613041 [Caerostris extrusa]